MKNYHFANKCRICSSTKLKLILDLGKQPPANAFLKKEDLNENENKFSLRLYFCQNCFLVQLLDIVEKEYLYSKYLYLTSASKPIVEHFSKYAQDSYRKFLKNKKNPLVVEIGSNDGSLLNEFKKLKVSVLGIEPAKNIAKIANEFGINTKNIFFTSKIAKKFASEKKANLIVANNVVGHIDDLKDLVLGISLLLEEDGVFIFEVPYLLDMIKNLEFDTIYHEHLSYFSLLPLTKLFEQFGLSIFNIQKQKVHGGTIRIFVCKKNSYKIVNNIFQIIENERNVVGNIKFYNEFEKDVKAFKDTLVSKLKRLKKDDKIIFGYGAPAKGNVLLNYCKINKEILDFVIDTTPLKQGMYTPGTHIPIYSPKIITKKGENTVALLLAWNYKDKILVNEKKFRKRGGMFLIPIPKPVLL